MVEITDADAARWTQGLRFTRLLRARGGHAHDGDVLALSLPLRDPADAVALMARLGAPLRALADDEPRVELGVPFASDRPMPPEPIRWLPPYAQPGPVVLLGVPCQVVVGAHDLWIYLSGADGDPWTVSEADAQAAARLEAAILAHGLTPRTP